MNENVQVQNFVSDPSTSSYTCGFKMENPKLPKFAGDVREYAIFKADFKHAIEARYTKRDSITFLRTCLHGKPLDLIKGIGTHYDAAWEYLDSFYDDPRFVSDTITQDIVKFRALQNGEDARFCDLTHLVRRCFNTLKEVGVPSDMDNSHMLSIIEQKMCTDDRKVWSRELERDGKKATFQGLIDWMTVEMKSRMRATAPLRTGSSIRSVNHFLKDDSSKATQHGTNVGCVETQPIGQTNVRSSLLSVSTSDSRLSKRITCASDALKGPEENTEWKLAPEDSVAQNRKTENNANIITIHSYTKATRSD